MPWLEQRGSTIQANPQGEERPKPLRAGVKEPLRNVLTQADWELIAASAGNSVQKQVMERFQTARTA